MSLLVKQLVGVGRLEDLGRPGRRRWGVPIGGAFDRESYALACALAGAPVGAAALELALGTIELTAEQEVGVAWAGAPTRAEVNGSLVEVHRITLGARCTLRLTALPLPGARVYLTLAGGIRSEQMLGSVSGSPIPSRLIPERKARWTRLSLDSPPEPLAQRALRVIAGPQPGAEYLLGQSWQVAPASDRRGLRLDGPRAPAGPELTSEPVCVGAVQAPPGGTPIILGPDGPTIGGYPKPLVVASVDRDRLGQLKTGEKVVFQLIELDEARELAARTRERLAARLARISAFSES